ncbi:N-acetylmuramoyl-L-alanine amidase [Neobacillus muris]|uniref:N-acetylmuramoyl-L-alanine amidase n=1 Tax=Neobacillus muris TaxID=2941334 RepID=UPI00203D4CC3|nr:N-acetylmuramoyl-L-alanine amidase [Neobacillus muris]
MKLYVDPGHGGNDPGAQGNGLNEKDITLDIAQRIRSILLNDYEDAEVMMSRTDDAAKSLSQRTNEANAWGAQFYLSIHINSGPSSALGYEDYIYSGLPDSAATAKYQDFLHEEIAKLNQLADRGQKRANFHVLRESAMPALLSENGFISNAHDSELMKQPSWRQNVAQGHANGLARAFGLSRKAAPAPAPAPNPAPGPGKLYKLIAGSFTSIENANNRAASLHSQGIEAFVKAVTISGKTWYRVQAGAFSSPENAQAHLGQIRQAGYSDAFLIAE